MMNPNDKIYKLFKQIEGLAENGAGAAYLGSDTRIRRLVNLIISDVTEISDVLDDRAAAKEA